MSPWLSTNHCATKYSWSLPINHKHIMNNKLFLNTYVANAALPNAQRVLLLTPMILFPYVSICNKKLLQIMLQHDSSEHRREADHFVIQVLPKCLISKIKGSKFRCFFPLNVNKQAPMSKLSLWSFFLSEYTFTFSGQTMDEVLHFINIFP